MRTPTTSSALDRPWRSQAARVEAGLRRIVADGLSGVYVHGSAALGGWSPGSDLDVLVVATRDDLDWESVGTQLLLELHLEPAVELSIVRASDAATPQQPWPFLLHVNQQTGRVVTDAGRGDPDLLMHYLVARRSGITFMGPPAEALFGEVPRPVVLGYLDEELSWACDHADARYAVLNACRALAYAHDGLILSKIDGGRWALRNGAAAAPIKTALEAQRVGRDLGPLGRAARQLVDAIRVDLMRVR